MDISALKLNPKNPRTITPAKLAMLRKSLKEFGDLSGVVFNRKTKQLVGGHQRLQSLDKKADYTVTKQYEKPSRTGTVAEGYIVSNGERFSYREVVWSSSKEKAANIAANKGAGEWNVGQLSEWMKDLSRDITFDLDLTMFDQNERAIYLQDVERINNGSENDEWAKMGDTEFVKGEKYIALAIHFKSEKARDVYVKKQKLDIKRKLANAWIVYL